MDIEQFEVSVRPYNSLRLAGIKTVEEIEQMAPSEFMKRVPHSEARREIWRAIGELRAKTAG